MPVDVLVAMTGRQMWSHLDALAQWGDGLEELVLLPAYDDDRPGGPVERLSRFAERHFPGLFVRVLDAVADDAPDAVFAAVAAVAAGPPPAGSDVADGDSASAAGRRIVVNASGGTRLMFLGAARAAGLIPSVLTVFRDDDGPWYQLCQDGSAAALGFLDRDATERFDITDLLEVTWADERRTVMHRKQQPAPHLVKAARQCLSGQHFHQAFTKALRSARRLEHAGHDFEGFIQALVLLMGADDVAVSVELRDRGYGVQEVDLVVNENGRLTVIDCKWRKRPETPIGTQIREAFATRQLLGDDTAQIVLMRPLMRIPAHSLALAADLDVRVVDAQSLAVRSLPEQLALLLSLPAPNGRLSR